MVLVNGTYYESISYDKCLLRDIPLRNTNGLNNALSIFIFRRAKLNGVFYEKAFTYNID